MRLLDKVCVKIEAAIGNLPVLAIIRDLYDYDCYTQGMRDPAGNGTITMYIVALMYPVGPTEHVTHAGVMMDPYCSQEEADRIVLELHHMVEKEIEAAGKTIMQAASQQEHRSPGGLVLG